MSTAPRFFFSGTTPGPGSQLWTIVTAPDGSPFAGAPIAVTAASTEPLGGPAGSNPQEITGLGGAVLWRAEGGALGTSWYVYAPAVGPAFQEIAPVALGAFDAARPAELRTLSVRSGDLVFVAANVGSDRLLALDETAGSLGAAPLPGADRKLLSDAGGNPAYVATRPTVQPPPFVAEPPVDAQQVFVVHERPGTGWQTLSTFSGDARNDIREIAGFRIVPDDMLGDEAKTVFFAGDYRDVFAATFRPDALWRFDLVYRGHGGYDLSAPRWLDLNGTSGEVPLAPRALTVSQVRDGFGGQSDTLFLFGAGALGEGRVFAYRFEPVLSLESWTSADLVGAPLAGLEIAPWRDGVVFTALGDNGLGGTEGVAATWTDEDGDGAYEMAILFSLSDATIEHLAVDLADGRIVFVVDEGERDTLYAWKDGEVSLIVQRCDELDEVILGGGQVVWRGTSLPGAHPTLFLHDFAAPAPIDPISTPEETSGGGVSGFFSAYADVAIPGALVFEAELDEPFFGSRLFLTDGTDVVLAGGGFVRRSEGAVLGSAWVGAGVLTETGERGLFRIDAGGNVTTLFSANANFASEAEALGDQVLFGTILGANSQVLLHDAGLGTTSVLLDTHLLGAAGVVGSRTVFSARDLTRAENGDVNPNNDIWDLWTYDPLEGAQRIVSLPAVAGDAQPVLEWWRRQDFLGDDGRLFSRQQSDGRGIEVWTIDLSAADPGSTHLVIETFPGPRSGAGFDDAVFAGGRLFWQATIDGTPGTLRLWTTTNGGDAVPVTGPDLVGGASPVSLGDQRPNLPVAIGSEVFFLARVEGGNGQGIFQVNDDGVTASLITPKSFGGVSSLAAIGDSLYLVAFDGANQTSQMFRLTPGETPAVSIPERLTNFPPLNGAGDMRDIFAGGDGNIYFGRLEPAFGRELHVLDVTDPRGARQVFDFNPGAGDMGYAPAQVTVVFLPAPSPPPPPPVFLLRLVEKLEAEGGVIAFAIDRIEGAGCGDDHLLGRAGADQSGLRGGCRGRLRHSHGHDRAGHRHDPGLRLLHPRHAARAG